MNTVTLYDLENNSVIGQNYRIKSTVIDYLPFDLRGFSVRHCLGCNATYHIHDDRGLCQCGTHTFIHVLMMARHEDW